MKNYLLFFLIFMLLLSAQAIADPIQITSEADLLNLMNKTNPFDDWSADYILTTNLDMAGEDCLPIGNDESEDYFTGTFNGNNKTISNVTIDGDGFDDDYIGFFGYIGSGGSVYDLSLVNVDITGEEYVGGFVGHNEGTIENCSVSGNVYAYSDAGGFVGSNYNRINNCSSSCDISANGEGSSYVFGGFAGENIIDLAKIFELETFNIPFPTISNCSATGNVECDDGGGGFVSINIGYIYNCTASGDVEGEYILSGFVVSNGLGFLLMYLDQGVDIIPEEYDFSDLSGLLENFSVIRNCSATGNVIGSSESFLVSGFCASNILGRIYNSRYNGSVGGDIFVSGFCGLNILANIFSSTVNNNSSVTGNAIVGGFVNVNLGYIYESHTFANVYSDIYSAAGFVNMNGLDISISELDIFQGTAIKSSLNNRRNLKKYFSNRGKRSINLQKVTSLGVEDIISEFLQGIAYIKNCSAKGSVYGGDFAGGFVDFNGLYFGSTQEPDIFDDIIPEATIGNLSYLEISECFATGSVSGSYDVGGFCSYNIAGTISNCYSTGNATSVQQPADLNGDTYAGGFCGYSEENSIDYCYSTGSASGGSVNGGFLGFNGNSNFTCSYWNTTNNPGLDGVGEGANPHTNSEIIGLSSTQMTQASNFACLLEDNEDKWKMTDDGPILTGTTIPTLSEWAVMIFIGLLAGVGGLFVWRRMI